jgi:squalene cyclase
MESPAIQNGVKFILSKQNPNGGWGESYVACVNKSYPPNGTGEVMLDMEGCELV